MYKRLKYFILTFTMALAILCFTKNKVVFAEEDALAHIHQWFTEHPEEYEHLNNLKSTYPYGVLLAPSVRNPNLSFTGYRTTYLYIITGSEAQWSISGNTATLPLYGSYGWEFDTSFNLVNSGTYAITATSVGNNYDWGYYTPILYSNYDITPVNFKGIVLSGGDINIGYAFYPHIAQYDGNIPTVGLEYYGDKISRNKTVFIPRFSLLVDPSTDTINTDGSWNDEYTVEYKLTLFVSTHEYANAIYNAYAENGKDVNNVRFQNSLASLLRANMPLGEATVSISGNIHPYSSSDFVTSPETLFYRDFAYYTDLVSPITVSGATQYDKNVLAPYVFRIKNAESRLKTTNGYGKTTVYAYNVTQDLLTFYTYTDEINDDRNIAIENALADLQSRYTELDTLFEQYKIDRQRLDAFSASESWYDIDIGKTAMQVIDIFDSMVDVVGSFADYTVMFMSWMPVSVLRLFIACLILNCIVSLYHALRG